MISIGRTFVDTNVFVYAFDDRDATKRQLAAHLVARHLESRSLVVSTQVLLELFVTLTRKLHPPIDSVVAEETVRTLGQSTVIPTDTDLVLAALARARVDGLSAWDAMIVEAARVGGCRVLLTEDLQHGRRFGDVLVENPFVSAV